MQLDKVNTCLIENQALQKHLQESVEDCNKQIVKIQTKQSILLSARQLFEKLLESSRENIQNNISKLVTQALQSILDTEDVEFQISFEFKRKQPEAYLYVKFGEFTGSISDSFGGGIEDIVGSVLKIVFSYLLGTKGPMCLDEPGKWIDAQSSVRFAEFLKQLNRKFAIQMFLITHKPEISEVADKLFEVYYDETESIVRSA